MYCEHCGATRSLTGRYCPACGQPAAPAYPGLPTVPQDSWTIADPPDFRLQPPLVWGIGVAPLTAAAVAVGMYTTAQYRHIVPWAAAAAIVIHLAFVTLDVKRADAPARVSPWLGVAATPAYLARRMSRLGFVPAVAGVWVLALAVGVSSVVVLDDLATNRRAEARYLAAVTNSRYVGTDADQGMLLDLGYGICGDFADGKSLDQITEDRAPLELPGDTVQGFANAVSKSVLMAVISALATVAAVNNLCPEYRSQLKRGLSNP